jgi:hypothetical protein
MLFKLLRDAVMVLFDAAERNVYLQVAVSRCAHNTPVALGVAPQMSPPDRSKISEGGKEGKGIQKNKLVQCKARVRREVRMTVGEERRCAMVRLEKKVSGTDMMCVPSCE